MSEYYLLIGIFAFLIGFGIAFFIRAKMVTQKERIARREARKILDDAKRRSETHLKEANLEAKDRLFKMKIDFEAETKVTSSDLKKKEIRLTKKEENIDRKIDQLERRDRELYRKEEQVSAKESEIEKKKRSYNELINDQKKQLEKISGLTAENAKELLIKAMENEARYEGAKYIKKIENETKEKQTKRRKRS